MNKNYTNLIIGKLGAGKTKKVFEMVEKIIGEGKNLFILDNKEIKAVCKITCVFDEENK